MDKKEMYRLLEHHNVPDDIKITKVIENTIKNSVRDYDFYIIGNIRNSDPVMPIILTYKPVTGFNKLSFGSSEDILDLAVTISREEFEK